MSQYTRLYCDSRVGYWELYHNTLQCIVTRRKHVAAGVFVSQYTRLYYDNKVVQCTVSITIWTLFMNIVYKKKLKITIIIIIIIIIINF